MPASLSSWKSGWIHPLSGLFIKLPDLDHSEDFPFFLCLSALDAILCFIKKIFIKYLYSNFFIVSLSNTTIHIHCSIQLFLIILYPLYELLQGIRSEVFIGTVNDVHTKSLKISEIWYTCYVTCVP